MEVTAGSCGGLIWMFSRLACCYRVSRYANYMSLEFYELRVKMSEMYFYTRFRRNGFFRI